ncbi:MAG: hypothetical protein KGJ09_07515 [Candidatus Omnitrophica bacterium]|nr:hypothetical protein [Candidatus Omnitrophota bacterium]MDE2214996.1 hypothetical protein [Candidatus Omnitrophota bacterium]
MKTMFSFLILAATALVGVAFAQSMGSAGAGGSMSNSMSNSMMNSTTNSATNSSY